MKPKAATPKAQTPSDSKVLMWVLLVGAVLGVVAAAVLSRRHQPTGYESRSTTRPTFHRAVAAGSLRRSVRGPALVEPGANFSDSALGRTGGPGRSDVGCAACSAIEEHTSELQSPYVISYAVFCLKKKK